MCYIMSSQTGLIRKKQVHQLLLFMSFSGYYSDGDGCVSDECNIVNVTTGIATTMKTIVLKLVLFLPILTYV